MITGYQILGCGVNTDTVFGLSIPADWLETKGKSPGIATGKSGISPSQGKGGTTTPPSGWTDPWADDPKGRPAPYTPPKTPAPRAPNPMDDAWKDRFSPPKTPTRQESEYNDRLLESVLRQQNASPKTPAAAWGDPWANDPKGRPASVPYTPPVTQAQTQPPATKPSGGGFWSNLFSSPQQPEPEPVFTLSIPPIIPYTEPEPNWYLIGSILAAVTVVGGIFLIGASK